MASWYVRFAVTVALFAVLASPAMFNIVSGLTGGLATNAMTGKPTIIGLVLHGIVFAILSGIIMRFLRPKKSKYGTLMFREFS